MTPLSTLGGSNGQANQINNRGDVVGLAENGTIDPTCPPPSAPFFEILEFKPVIWEKGKIQELPTFPGDPEGRYMRSTTEARPPACQVTAQA